MSLFSIANTFSPAGDQPKAISALSRGLVEGKRHQTLLGVTGSGKTFTAANVIAAHGRPTLVIAHNKTLAAQLASEYREFFPNHAVHYFVSYYDYYQPEAYVAVTDTYIEKETQINEEIDRLRHAATQALLTREDVIVVASVSCIYNLGRPEEYEKVHLKIEQGKRVPRADLVRDLVGIYFERTTSDLSPGTFRAIGNSVEIMPVNEKIVIRVELESDTVTGIDIIDGTSRTILRHEQSIFIFPAKHFVSDKESIQRAAETIKAELEAHLTKLQAEGKVLEAERLKRRTNYDLAMIREVGYVNGIENYSRHFDGRTPGQPPFSLLEYFPKKADGSPDFLTIIDESHVTLPQIGGMHAGDQARKKNLVEYGFRLPSAFDNRPLTFDEFMERVGQVIYTSATPGQFELQHSMPDGIVEQIIRPTGLIDPEIIVRPITQKGTYKGQVHDFIEETNKVVESGARVMMTTLTKRMAEDVAEYLKEKGMKAEYLHSDIKTIERIELLTQFRKGSQRGGFDVLVGVNLLREGLDLPEVELIGILDADKEGFLRSETSLIQTIGRAARNVLGRVILYADVMTGSMERAIGETNRRRAIQIAYNEQHGITPQTIHKKISDITDYMMREHDRTVAELVALDIGAGEKDVKKLIKRKEQEMNDAVKILDFETAAIIRDEIAEIEKVLGSAKKKAVKKNPDKKRGGRT
ncbi:MAG: UvrABC system protein B [Candidatus Campbellbacteria bacterium]